MNLLALDLGTTTGWATQPGGPGGRVESGVQVFDVRRGESPGMRYIRFRIWLAEMTSAGVELVVYEQAHHRGGAATEILAGLVTRVLEQCAGLGIDHQGVHSATLKKWVTGRGNAKKPDMLAAAARRGWIEGPARPMDDNQVDALCLLHYGRAMLAPADRAVAER